MGEGLKHIRDEGFQIGEIGRDKLGVFAKNGLTVEINRKYHRIKNKLIKMERIIMRRIGGFRDNP